MSDHYIQLNCVTVGEEVEKSKPSENLGATSLPQIPQQNYQITQNIVIQATPIQNDNRNNKALVYQEKNNVIASPNKCYKCYKYYKESLPKGYLKAIILNYLFFIICLIDIIVQSSLRITDSLSIFSNIFNMIFSIIFLIILHAKASILQVWISILLTLMIFINLLCGSYGLALNTIKIDKKNDDDEDTLIITYISIFAIKMIIMLFIIFSYIYLCTNYENIY